MLGCEDCRVGRRREKDREVMSSCKRNWDQSARKKVENHEVFSNRNLRDKGLIMFDLHF